MNIDLTNDHALIEKIKFRIHQGVVEYSVVLKGQYDSADDVTRQQLDDIERAIAQQLVARLQESQQQKISAHSYLNDNFGQPKSELRKWLIKAVADGYASVRGS